ncbi:MAG: hypothetical protein M1826_004788 [Phylliscum demangeonii]|nr:MAG: hypothetical protein M1826_004788 [Phylliscum demangeonii]
MARRFHKELAAAQAAQAKAKTDATRARKLLGGTRFEVTELKDERDQVVRAAGALQQKIRADGEERAALQRGESKDGLIMIADVRAALEGSPPFQIRELPGRGPFLSSSPSSPATPSPPAKTEQEAKPASNSTPPPTAAAGPEDHGPWNRVLGAPMNVSAWRQIAIAIDRRLCKDHPGADHGDPAMEIHHLQASHSARTGNLVYANRVDLSNGLTDVLLHQYRELSFDWWEVQVNRKHVDEALDEWYPITVAKALITVKGDTTPDQIRQALIDGIITDMKE